MIQVLNTKQKTCHNYWILEVVPCILSLLHLCAEHRVLNMIQKES